MRASYERLQDAQRTGHALWYRAMGAKRAVYAGVTALW